MILKKQLLITVITSVIMMLSTSAQEYFLKNKGPFNPEIPSPKAFLGYGIGDQHTRHDQVVAYLTKLAELSDRATIADYGKTHENRRLVMLTVSTPKNINNLERIKAQHLAFTDTNASPTNYNDVPIFIQLGYNVHGNEPSSTEASLLMAYTLVASNSSEIKKYLENSIIFIDPTINPDGRDRHTQWANQYKSNPLVSDNNDAEHNEAWPRGRTNHFWFDLNRDWLLAINPESRGKLNWYHQWYPNVVTDFHEMGTNSTYFFEPMKPIGSQDPIMPKENYEDLNNLFAGYYSDALDNIGSFYFTKEAYDGTYPGYGSSYPDLQGALALLFEQASSRGHLQDTDFGTISFPFTIRNQYISSITTVKAAVENKVRLRQYQQRFFKSAIKQNPKSGIAAYEFGDKFDKNRTKAFIDKLLIHKIKVYEKDEKYVVPLKQPQQRMVQTMFETYSKYRDSVFYDASAWSVANFYNMKYKGLTKSSNLGTEVTSIDNLVNVAKIKPSTYAYVANWDDYNTPGALYYMQSKGLIVSSAFKPFSVNTTNNGVQDLNYGSLLIPISRQSKSSTEVYTIIKEAQEKFNVPVFGVNSGLSVKGIDLGSRNFLTLQQPKAALLIGEGINSLEAGEVWHLLDTRVNMPISKIRMQNFGRANLDKYNTLVMVSGRYNQLSKTQKENLKNWASKGNTLITIANASSWLINQKLVKETLTKKEKDSTKTIERLPYVEASEHIGRERLGGAIFEVDLDLTHPLAFGYRSKSLPVYKNNLVFLAPSKNTYSTVAKYTKNPHIDGYISNDNLEHNLKPSASLIVSPMGSGRAVMFADNPNFRGSWYGTNRLFLNALFLGSTINVPRN